MVYVNNLKITKVKFITKYLSLVLMIFHQEFVQSQKPFHIEIIVPAHIKTHQLGIEYDNGRNIVKPVWELNGNTIIVTDIFYSKFATLILTYQDTVNHFFHNRFFITEKPARIELADKGKNTSVKNPLLNYKSVNVTEIYKTRSARRCSLYIKNEFRDLESFFSENRDKMIHDDSLKMIFGIKSKNLYYKKLEFIKKYGHLYFSFWLFKTEMVPHQFYTRADSLLEIFNQGFNHKLRNSIEGREVYKLLRGRAYTKNGFHAPDFQTRDILGNKIELDKLKGKYVILNFWASWCVPCIHHILKLQEISKKIETDALQIISISYDKDLVKCKDMIIKLKMNWINIISDEQIIKIYGEKPVPGLYLIDPNGKIIANNYEDGDELFFEKLKRHFPVQ